MSEAQGLKLMTLIGILLAGIGLFMNLNMINGIEYVSSLGIFLFVIGVIFFTAGSTVHILKPQRK